MLPSPLAAQGGTVPKKNKLYASHCSGLCLQLDSNSVFILLNYEIMLQKYEDVNVALKRKKIVSYKIYYYYY